MRKLASIQTIDEINLIEGADNIVVASVLGWKVVVRKGEFNPGDTCVYVEIDSLLPIRPEFEFLRKNCYRKLEDGTEWFRIKTCKLRKQISQGICFPLTILPRKSKDIHSDENFTLKDDYIEDEDVTDILGIIKYDPPVKGESTSGYIRQFPSFIHKTDETRIQSVPDVVWELLGHDVYISTKVDGTSATYYVNGEESGVCSHNFKMDDGDNIYWKIEKELHIIDKLKKIQETTFNGYKNFAIQGEIAGPGIQKNRLKLETCNLFVFNVYCIDTGRHLAYHDFRKFCEEVDLDTVPIDSDNINFNDQLCPVDTLIEMARGKYLGTTNNREGIVIRPIDEMYSNILRGRMSFKVVNNDYLMKEEE
jgi:RNA ligase (TIGR02306 family)